MIRRVLLLLFAIFSVFFSGAQYVNTDELVVVPGKELPISLAEYDAIQDSLKALRAGYLSEFQVPGNGGYIISRFGPRSGRMHYGTDLKMYRGDTIVATNNGTIARAGWGTGFGRLVIIQHKNNIQTYYAHLTKFLVARGQYVKKGEPIGLAGSTGRARGPHLHFEMRENGRPFDSEMVFDYGSQQVRKDAWEEETLASLHRKLKPKGYANNVAVPEFYKVRSGDSLWKISRRFKTSIKEICKLNKITENTVLRVGQGLRLY